MVTLKCDVRTCTYNKENCCCKGDISVGGKSACDCSQTCCDSFKEAKGDQYLSALEHPSKMIDIDCEAVKCIYNSDYKCNADNVKIGKEAKVGSADSEHIELVSKRVKGVE